MTTLQTRFPYLLITTNMDVLVKATEISVNGLKHYRGVYSFQADLPFEQAMEALSTVGGEVALIQAAEYQYIRAAGDVAELLGHMG